MHLGWPPRRLLLTHRHDRLIDHRQPSRPVDPTTLDNLIHRLDDKGSGVMAEPADLFRPTGMQHLGVHRMCLSLSRAAVNRCLAFKPPPFPRSRVATHRVAEPIELVVEPPADVLGSSGELDEDIVGDVANLGDAVRRLLPADAQVAGQLRPQTGVVDRRQRLLIQLDQPGIQRQPATIG